MRPSSWRFKSRRGAKTMCHSDWRSCAMGWIQIARTHQRAVSMRAPAAYDNRGPGTTSTAACTLHGSFARFTSFRTGDARSRLLAKHVVSLRLRDRRRGFGGRRCRQRENPGPADGREQSGGPNALQPARRATAAAERRPETRRSIGPGAARNRGALRNAYRRLRRHAARNTQAQRAELKRAGLAVPRRNFPGIQPVQHLIREQMRAIRLISDCLKTGRFR